MPIPAIASAAIQLAPVIGGLFRRKKKAPDANAILSRYRDARPEGYVTEADKAAAERTRTTMAGAAQNVAQQRRMMNARNTTARRLQGPAAAALEQQATDVAAQGAENAARNSAQQLYGAYNSNLGFERQKMNTAFGAEMGLAAQQQQQNQAEDAAFWNTAMETIPTIAGAFKPKKKA